MSSTDDRIAKQEEWEAACRLYALRQAPLSLPLNLYSNVNQRNFFSPLILIMEELYPHLACKPIILHSCTRTNYAWNLIFRSWCPIHNAQHSQQHWTIFQYHKNTTKETYQYLMCFKETTKKVKLQGIPFYDELENNKDY